MGLASEHLQYWLVHELVLLKAPWTKLGRIQVIGTDRVFVSRPGMGITGSTIGVGLAAQEGTWK